MFPGAAGAVGWYWATDLLATLLPFARRAWSWGKGDSDGDGEDGLHERTGGLALVVHLGIPNPTTAPNHSNKWQPHCCQDGNGVALSHHADYS